MVWKKKKTTYYCVVSHLGRVVVHTSTVVHDDRSIYNAEKSFKIIMTKCTCPFCPSVVKRTYYIICTSRVLLPSASLFISKYLLCRTSDKCAAYTPERKALRGRRSNFFFSAALDFFLIFLLVAKFIFIYVYAYNNMYIIIIRSTFSLKTVTSADGGNILLLLPIVLRSAAKNAYTIHIMYSVVHTIYARCTREIDGITRSVPIL